MTKPRPLLQWGHAFSDVEMLKAALDESKALFVASMGPRLFRRGNCRISTPGIGRLDSFNGATPFQTWKFLVISGHFAALFASMGPRLFRRGNHRRKRQLSSLTAASMGPRLFRRGNAVEGAVKPSMRALLQWGHAFSDVEMISWGAFGSIFTELQWGHAFSDVEIWRSGSACGSGAACFNGATPFQTWKLPNVINEYIARLKASMGPRLFRRGNGGHTPGGTVAQEASMGPRLFRRGNPVPARQET